MGFLQKLWKDRISQFPKRYALKQQANGITQQVELELQDGVIQEAGDTFNAATMNDLEQRIADAIQAVESGEGSISAQLFVDDTPFYFDKKDGQFGFNTSPSRGADTFHPFSTIHTLTKTITSKTTTDMGERHEFRYVDTTNVANTNSGTYTFPANDTGGTKDLGVANSYRYVNAGNVYNKGKADGDIKHSCYISVTCDIDDERNRGYATATLYVDNVAKVSATTDTFWPVNHGTRSKTSSAISV